MSFIINNLAVLHVAILTCGLAWVYGGTRAPYLLAFVPWLWALLLEGMLFFPQRRMGENSAEARERVWAAMRHDPFVWVSLAFLFLLTIPLFNTALCPTCDAALLAQGFSAAPPIRLLPFCFRQAEHLGVILWFLPALTAAIATRHALNRDGKRLLIEMVVWNGVALAVLGALQQALGAKGPLWCDAALAPTYFFSTFGYANMAGDYFTTIFLLATAVWRQRVEEVRDLESMSDDGHDLHGHRHHGERNVISHRRFWQKHYPLIAAAIAFFAALNTLSRASIMLVSLAAFVVFLHSSVVFLGRMKRVRRVKAGAIGALVIVGIAVAAVLFMPTDVRHEMDTVDTRGVLNRVSGKGIGDNSRALAIWREHVFFGCGGWGYKHLSKTKMSKKAQDAMRTYTQPGGANVHNDFLQFLVEHGLAGFLCLAAGVFFLVAPVMRIWSLLAKGVRFMSQKDQPPAPRAIFVMPAPAVFILLAALATCAHACGDCPLRSPAILTLFFVELAALPGYLPRVRQISDENA